MNRRPLSLLSLFRFAALTLAFLGHHTASAQPAISATQDDSVPALNRKLRGESITNVVTITNSGNVTATGVALSGATPANTSENPGSVRITPIAVDDAYTAVGNSVLTIPAATGLLVNDFDPDGGTNFVKAGSVVRTGGTASPAGTMTVAPDGSFSYLSGVGALGTDIFRYTITDMHGQDSVAPGIVTFTMTDRVWYVQNSTTVGDGRSSTPFNNLTSASTAANGTNDIIYVFSDIGANAKLNGNIVLDNQQRLFGQAVPLVVSGLSLYSANTAPTLINTTGNIVSAAQNNTISGLVLGNRLSSAINGNPIGTLTVSNLTINGTGQGLNLANGTLNATIDSLSSSSAVNGIVMTSVSGTLTINAGLLTGLTGSDVFINGGNGNITFPGSITDLSGGRCVDILNRTGGTILFTGTITNNGAGILLQNNTGATVNFDGAIGLNTGSNPAFAATGGGTVNAANAANTLTTTTGTALNVANATIGVTGLRFRSINVSGAVNGIVLNNTGSSGGSVTVTGDGSTASSGGTIQNTTGTAIVVTSSRNFNFSFMRIFQPQSGLLATDLAGVNILQKCVFDYGNTTIAGAYAFRVANTSVNATITLDGVAFQNKLDGTTAVSVSAMGTSAITFNVQDSNTGDSFQSLYTNLFGSGIVVGSGDNAGSTANVTFNVSNSRFVNAPANGLNNLEMGVNENAILVPNISNNVFDRVGLPLAVVGIINVNTTGSGRLGNATSALFARNTISNSRSGVGPAFAYDAAGLNGYYGMRIAVDNNGVGINHKIKILTNSVTEIARVGLYVSTRGNANDVNVLIEGNTIGTLANPVGHGNVRGVHLETQSNSVMKVQVANNPSIVTKSSSGSNSSLHLRSGVDNISTATLQATITGNTIRNAGTAPTAGRFRAQTLGAADGLTSATGKICLDLRNNNLEDGTRLFELIHNSGGTYNRVDSGNIGTITTSGGSITAIGSCPLPVVP